MGKLLQKIVRGIAPSWLTRVKSSPKMLPPPTAAIKSSPSNTIRDHDRRSDNAVAAAPATARVQVSYSVASETPPSSMQHAKTNAPQQNGKHKHTDNDDMHQYSSHKIHQFEHNNDHHHLHHAAKDNCSHRTHMPATQIHTPKQQEGEGIQDENQHLRHRYHQCNVERSNCNHGVLGSGKRSPPGIAHEAHIGDDAERKNRRHDVLGFKRKSRYSEEEEEKRGGSSKRGWEGKRRKREEGLMSCELPEDICGVVGNAKAVVKYSQEPKQAMWESMVEMIVGNGLWELGSLEVLLFCYLSLNEAHLHSIIQSTFLQVLKDLERTS